MMGITSLHNTLFGWFVRMSGSKPSTRQAAQGCILDAEELRSFHQALHTAYRVFAHQHPAWVQRGFDETFLRTDAVTLLMTGWAADGAARPAITGMDLARVWERKYGLLLSGANRVTLVARLAGAANVLLATFSAARLQR
ncbi:MAG TPA: hypothetical protein GYA08_01045 [Chloroflexi bacterium]|nr:hypothetical protein [Chloroflexota bacterium]